MTDTYHCDRCGLRLLVDLEPELRCLMNERGGHHCHAGERLACADGGVQFAVASPDCHVVNVYPVEL